MPTGEPDLVPGAGGGGAALTGEPDLAQVAGEDGVAPAAQPDLGSHAEPGTTPTAAATRRPSQEGAAGENEPADWKPDIMQAPNQSRVVILDTGETEPARDRAARSPRPIAPDDPGGADTADDPDPLPPPQDQPEGQL
jgi:hypothetical protein